MLNLLQVREEPADSNGARVKFQLATAEDFFTMLHPDQNTRLLPASHDSEAYALMRKVVGLPEDGVTEEEAADGFVNPEEVLIKMGVRCSARRTVVGSTASGMGWWTAEAAAGEDDVSFTLIGRAALNPIYERIAHFENVRLQQERLYSYVNDQTYIK
jgi:hypothetical protein